MPPFFDHDAKSPWLHIPGNLSKYAARNFGPGALGLGKPEDPSPQKPSGTDGNG